MSIIDKLFKKASLANIPLVTTFEITENCNFKCHHCYNFDRNSKLNNEVPIKKKILTKNEILKIIDQLAEAGTLYLNFTGGEVLLHPHLNDFIKRANFHHLETRIKTNGSLLDFHRCKKLKAAGLSGMDISLYGYSSDSYEKLTTKAEVFQKTLEGIILAQNEGFNIHISIILHRYNIDELDLMINFCQKHKLQYQFSTDMSERYDGSLGAKNYELTAEQFKQQLNGKHSFIFKHSNPEKALQCSCAKTVCGISSIGDVFPCIGAPLFSGNLRENSFSDIWKNSEVLNQIRSLETKDFKSCQTCEHIEYCNRSSGGIYVNTKNYTGCDTSSLFQAMARHELELTNKI